MIIEIKFETRVKLDSKFGDYLKNLGYSWEKLLSFHRYSNGDITYILRD